jgi:peptide/nickel transport system substrate-binding protein
MVALYRSGRQSEALDAYVAARRRLVEDVGIEPGAELRELHARILAQDPALRRPRAPRARVGSGRAPPAEPTARARTAHVRRLVIGAGVAVLVALAIFAVTRLTGPDHLAGISEGGVGVIDPDAFAITDEYRLGGEAGALAAGGGSVWVADPHAGTVSRIHPGTASVETIDVGLTPASLAFGAGSLWVVGGDRDFVAQVDARANRVVQQITVGNGPQAVAVGYGALWVATALDGEVVRIDLRTRRLERIPVGGHPVALAIGHGAIWAAGEESAQVVRIDPRSREIVDAIPVGSGPSAVIAGLGAVWAANRQDGTVSQIDPATDRVTQSMPAGRAPVALAIAADALWVADAGGGIIRLDPQARGVARTVRTGSSPAGMATVDDALWVTGVAPPTAHRGGTLRFGVGPILFDPASGGYDAEAMPLIALAYDGLLRFRRAPGTAGTSLEPALAIAVPEPADGGRRYVLRLRPGLRFSDGTTVAASDFRASVERLAAIQGNALALVFGAIEGVPECVAMPRHCDLARGIATDDRAGTITIRLSRPDPDLPQKLAVPIAAVLPASTPHRDFGSDPAPGTGPYRIDRIDPGHRAVFTRNPHFDGSPAGFVDRVDVTMGKEEPRVRATTAGRLDMTDLWVTATPRRLAALQTSVGGRLKSASRMFTEFAWLNVRAAPFDDVHVRRAINFAVDRGRAVDVTGGPLAGGPTCQVIPAGLPGYRPTCPFTIAPSPTGAWSAPDIARARRLVAASGTHGMRVDIATYGGRRALAGHLAEVLRRLGYRVSVHVFPTLSDTYPPAVRSRRPPQMGINGWIADYPAPANFLRTVLGCDSYVPGEPYLTFNFSRFCDPRLDAAIDRAEAADASAGDAWQRIERRIAAQAPMVPLVDRRKVTVTSPRLGNLQVHLQTGPMLEQVWVR